MSINIGLLYPSRLSLYGESGNVKALQYFLKKEEIDTSIENIDDLSTADLNKFDFIYIGSGLETGLSYAEINILENKNKIVDYIEHDGYLLSTGNSMRVFKNFNYFKLDVNDDYYVADVSARDIDSNNAIRAFQNTKYLVSKAENPVFDIFSGYGNEGSKMEGFRYKNFIVTSFIGPILAINAGLRNYYIDRIKERHGNNTK